METTMITAVLIDRKGFKNCFEIVREVDKLVIPARGENGQIVQLTFIRREVLAHRVHIFVEDNFGPPPQIDLGEQRVQI